ncbi:sigma-54-dependent transcriptional regulator FlbD [Hypericibacter sp.]|uniref:sigma-54-dependent transcriptional regulator FlbD n=1 Tax=Hypericibacter sp. TaxID=2705401 RepID=UPI003D6D1C26
MRLLIVGSLDGPIATAGKIALSRGAKVAQVGDIDGAMEALRAGQGADLLLCDVRHDIARLIAQLKTERISLPVVACGIGTETDVAVRAIKAGAKDYLPLPPDAELIAAILAAVAEESSAFIYRDPIMREVLRLADQIAPSDASVMITGESGTGKEVMARYLHSHGKRATRPFISVNCAAIPEHLLESELFGHERGAFTGAIARRIGKFEEANGGTLLLDEISEMHPRLQAKLLRAIQEREIDRVGGTQPIKVDIRLIATSNRDLEIETRNGNFREDLYFRLNVVTLELPSLRNRPADIPALAEHFIKKYALANAVQPPALSAGAEAILVAHSWRGNVRELENTMHRAVLLSKGSELGPDAIMLTGQRGAPSTPEARAVAAIETAKAQVTNTAGLVGRTVADVERDLILETLNHCLGNRTHAANILGISIRTLRNKLKQYSEEGILLAGGRAANEGERQAV